MRRGSIVQLIVIGVLAGGVASAVALIPNWLPDPASREAGRIHFVFWFVTGICIFIFAIVAAVSIYTVWKFRVQPDDDSDGPPIHGHTGLEIAWTAVPTLLVVAIAIVSAIVLAKNDAEGADPLRVDVTAQQFFCRADVRAGTINCAGPERAPGQGILGNQGVNVGLRSTNVS